MTTPATSTPGPWYCLSDEDGRIAISNTVGPRWAANEHYVGRVNERDARLVCLAPDLRDFVERVAQHGDGLTGTQAEAVLADDTRKARTLLARAKGGGTERDAANCECYHTCAENPATGCSLSGRWHVHAGEPCPVHPNAPGDR